MTNVFIIHGTEGSPEGNWFPWLKSALEKLGCRVFAPKFPTPEGQSLESWLKVFEDYKKYLDKDSIVVGHSLGPAFLLSVLEKLNHPIKAAFLVAGWIGLLGDPHYDPLTKTFADREFDWSKIKKACKKFYVFHGDDDPYVPLGRGRELARNLNAELVIVPKGKHLNAEFGYTRFELLLGMIKKEL